MRLLTEPRRLLAGTLAFLAQKVGTGPGWYWARKATWTVAFLGRVGTTLPAGEQTEFLGTTFPTREQGRLYRTTCI